MHLVKPSDAAAITLGFAKKAGSTQPTDLRPYFRSIRKTPWLFTVG